MTAEFKGRREDHRLVTGQGKYASDWNLPGQLYGAFLRSDRAHAEIGSIDIRPALAMPGVVAVLTGADTAQAKLGVAQPIFKFPGKGGMMLKVPHRDVLASTRVRFVGQEVALVVAETAALAHDAAEAIAVEYRDLPLVVDAEAALAPGAPQLHADISGNLCYDFEYGDEAKTADAFARAAHVTRLTLESQRMVGNPMEPKACLAAYDAAKDVYDLYSSSQGISHILSGLTTIFGLPESKFRPHARDVGGGFGIRSDAYVEYAAALLAARQLGRPVKWVSTRSETFMSDYHGRDVRLNGELALDRDGKFIGIRFRWYCNMGAYLSQPGPIISTMTTTVHAVNAYRIPALYGRHSLALTNTTPTTAYRGAGPAQRVLHHRAAGRAGGAGDGQGPGGAAPHQPDTEGGVSLQDACIRVRQRRPSGIARSGDRSIRMEDLRSKARGVTAERKVARHRLRRVHRALGRRLGAQRGGRAQVR